MSIFFRVAFWLGCVAIATLSLLPLAKLPPDLFDWWDKAQHALGFLVLATLGFLGYSVFAGRVVLCLLSFGAVIECAQFTTGLRYGDWQDWLADAIGVALAYGIWRVAQQILSDNALMGGSSDV